MPYGEIVRLVVELLHLAREGGRAQEEALRLRKLIRAANDALARATLGG